MFKIEPGKATPSSPSDPRAAIERATQAFNNAGKVQDSPVQNPTQVAPEEMSAISRTSEESTPQKDITEAPAPKEPASEATTKEEPLSSQYAQLARKEKAIRQARLELKAKEDSIAKREAEFAAKTVDKAPEGPSLKDRAAKDPLGVMQEQLGLTYEQLTELVLNQDPNQAAYKSEISALRAELQAIRDESQKVRQEDQQTQYKNAVAQIRDDVSALVKTDEAYETIRETGSVDDVVELIEATFKEEGRVMSIDEAAQLVEDHLVEEAYKLTKLKKIQSRLTSLRASEAAPAKQQQVSQQQPAQAKTLTNSMATNRPLTAKERAILAFEGKLNKTGT